MSELIVIILLIISLAMIYGLYYYLDKRGLYFSVVILSIITFIFNFKITEIFKMNVNLGIVSLVATLTIFYIYLIKYGKKEIKDLIVVSLITNIITAIMITAMNYYIPAITETISINMEGTFEYNYKILIVYPIIMLASQYAVSRFYSFISSLQNNDSVSIILTYIITGSLYTIIFYVLAYIKVLAIKDSIFIGTTTYIAGLVFTLISIAFIKLFINSKKVAK